MSNLQELNILNAKKICLRKNEQKESVFTESRLKHNSQLFGFISLFISVRGILTAAMCRFSYNGE